jgi:phosphohistidine phosphatase SixA
MRRRWTNSKDAALSPAGEARARALAAKLRDAGVTAIFTTQLQRTKATAQPLADSLKIAPVVHPADDTTGLVALLHKERGRTLVVGHSNTLPEIAAAYGMKLSVADDEFDGLFVLIPATKTLLHLHQ